MSRNKGMGVGGVLIVIFLLVLALGGAWFVWDYLASHERVEAGPGDVADRVSELLSENQQLREELNATQQRAEEAEAVAQEQGLSTGLVLMLVVVVFMATIGFLTAQMNQYGGNITRDQAKELAARIVDEEHGWRAWDDLRGGFPLWVDRQVQGGQAVDGDVDTLWFVVQFAKDKPEGGAEIPGHLCITVLIRSNDPTRQVYVERGMNASQAAKKHGIKLQRSPDPTDLGKMLQHHSELGNKLRAITGDNDEI